MMKGLNKIKNIPPFLILTSPNEVLTLFSIIKAHLISGNDLINLFTTQFFYFRDSKDKQPLITLFQDFLDDKTETSYDNIEFKIIEKINEYQQKNQHYCISKLFFLFICCLLDQNRIQTEFAKLFDKIKTQNSDYIYLQNFENYAGFNSDYTLCVDNKFNFYFQKSYKTINSQLFEKEKQISKTDFSNEYPSFIIRYELKDNKIIIPYYPLLTLNNYIAKNLNSKKPSLIEKFIMIKEIGIGISQLHERSIFHLNLNSFSIFIDNKKDIYISNFAFNLDLEKNEKNKKLIEKTYHYLHPDLIKDPEYHKKLYENSNNSDVKARYDIYSFGVLMYEIISGKIIEQQNFDKKNKLNNFDLINKLHGFQRIIEKCVNTEINNSYSSIKEILSDLNELDLYLTNKDEIEYKIKNSNNSYNYECNFSDLVINYYYQKDEFSKDIITSLLSRFDSLNNSNKMPYNDNDLAFQIIYFFAQENDKEKLYQKKYNFTKERIASMLMNPSNMQCILNPEKFQIEDATFFIKFYDNLFLFLSDYVNNEPLIKSYKTFVGGNDYSSLKAKVTEKIKDILERKQYYYLLNLFLLVIKNILDQKTIEKRYNEIMPSTNFTQDLLTKIEGIQNSSDFNSTISLCVDRNCNFYQQKDYGNISKDVILKEVEIYNKKFETDGYQRFIVHSDSKFNNNKIDFSYFPFNSLKSFLKHVKENELTINFGPVDKFVIIKELAIGMNQLYENSFTHMNLYNLSILVDDNKDSYIANIAYDLNNEPYHTTATTLYYRHKDFLKILQKEKTISQSLKNNEIKPNITHDIYSFGILMHEIITTIHPEDRFTEARKERIENMLDHYKKILFSGFKDSEFDDKYGIKGIQRIIENCMNLSYSSFKEILSELNQLEINNTNKEEIEYRFKNSHDVNEYKCNFSDLVVNYYEGNCLSKTFIESLFVKIDSNIPKDDDEEKNKDKPKLFNYCDVITQTLNIFDFKNSFKDNSTIIYDELFNYKIQQNLNQKIQSNFSKLTQNQAKLMSLSISFNLNPDKSTLIDQDLAYYQDFISTTKCLTNLVPITTLENFIENNYLNDEMIPIFIFFIVKEILLIHSYNLYHGEISLKSIGIYFNTKIKTLLPLIISFYYFYKNGKKNSSQPQTINNENIGKYQQKDIKHLIKIIQIIDKNSIIPQYILDLESISLIIFELSKFLISQQNELFLIRETYEKYSSFQLTYSKIYEIFICLSKFDKIYKIMTNYLINNISYLDLEKVITEIYNFFIVEKCNKDYLLDEAIDKITKIETMLKLIKKTNDEMIIEYQNEISKKVEINQNETSKKETEFPYIDFLSFTKFKQKDINPKTENIINKKVNRCLKLFKDLKKKSFEFLFKRYIYNLQDDLTFKITVNFVSKNNNNVSSNDVVNICRKMNINNFEFISDENVIFIYKRTEDFNQSDEQDLFN